ncbi:MAG TPA: biotin transporter BioY [Actinomycetota bacterium]|nr:biotin transporter BioY [Actinomycetota bacterium]
MSTIALTLAPPRSRVAARVTFEIACAVVGSFLIAGLAQITFALPFTPVPITGQTLGVLLVGAAYGPGLGAATILLYLVWAVVGLPVLAPVDGVHATGLDVLRLTAATGGYLWGFVLAAALTGWLARCGWDRTFRSSIGAMLLGSIVIYAVALPWLHHVLASSTIEETLQAGLYPFIIGDTLKLLAAAGVLPAAWALMKKLRPRNRISSEED